MKALIFNGIEDIRCEQLPDPGLVSETDALVRVTCAAICGSDLHPYHGREVGLDRGTVMGHEFAGEVLEVGAAVTRFKRGDRVTSPFTTNCGHCFYCMRGLTCRCVHGQLFGWVAGGQGLHGAQAEYVRVPMADHTLFPLPVDLDDEIGLMLGDILPTGYFTATGAEIHGAGTYAVIGCGPVGLMALLSARHLGAGQIYALDRVPERLAMAERIGAIPLDIDREDPVAVLRRATQGRGADAVLELVGNAAAGRLAFELVRPGGIVSVAGVHNERHFAFSPGEAYDKNLTYKVGRCPARHFMAQLLPLAQASSAVLRQTISHRLPLSEGPHGYHLFAQKLENCTKVMLAP